MNALQPKNMGTKSKTLSSGKFLNPQMHYFHWGQGSWPYYLLGPTTAPYPGMTQSPRHFDIQY